MDALRTRAIERLLPALVHRLNNSIAVFQGVFELGPAASERDRENARLELATLSNSLARLSLFARSPSVREQVYALDSLHQACALLLQPLAATLHVDFELREHAGLSVRADARLETYLCLAAFELLLAASTLAQPRVVRLAFDSQAGHAVLTLAARGALPVPRAAQALAEYARARGFALAQHASPRGIALRLRVPLLSGGQASEVRPRPAPCRVLLVQDDGQDRELAATWLREQGCTVRETSGAPATGEYELVLVDEQLCLRDPLVLRRLEQGLAYRRLARIRPPLRPAQLLDLLRG